MPSLVEPGPHCGATARACALQGRGENRFGGNGWKWKKTRLEEIQLLTSKDTSVYPATTSLTILHFDFLQHM